MPSQVTTPRGGGWIAVVAGDYEFVLLQLRCADADKRRSQAWRLSERGAGAPVPAVLHVYGGVEREGESDDGYGVGAGAATPLSGFAVGTRRADGARLRWRLGTRAVRGRGKRRGAAGHSPEDSVPGHDGRAGGGDGEEGALSARDGKRSFAGRLGGGARARGGSGAAAGDAREIRRRAGARGRADARAGGVDAAILPRWRAGDRP